MSSICPVVTSLLTAFLLFLVLGCIIKLIFYEIFMPYTILTLSTFEDLSSSMFNFLHAISRHYAIYLRVYVLY